MSYTDKRITGDCRTFDELVAKLRGWFEHDKALGETREDQLRWALSLVEDVHCEIGGYRRDDVCAWGGFSPQDLEYALIDAVNEIHEPARVVA